MTARELSFGYYSGGLDVTAGNLTIRPLQKLDKAVSAVTDDEGVDGDWIYAPPQEVSNFGGGITQRPYPSRVFGLPKTHTIRHASPDGEDHLIFHLWALSFFTGTRLTSTEAGFLDATPIKPGKLVDFVLLGRGLPIAIELAETFWATHRAQPQRARLVAAAVHALFLGQNPLSLQFERFLILYTAFDACFALAKSIHGTVGVVRHAERVAWMCGLFAMQIPVWADPAAPSGPEVASLRNETVHEALFMGEPLGFALHGVGTNKNLTLEMEALICRLIVALLGASSADYVRSPVNTRQRHGLKLD
ncbi:MAG: hypothetical protein K2Y17_09025 [Qipengyuania sp.]|nr:hypothetical protein [Qipengyuania sp.]